MRSVQGGDQGGTRDGAPAGRGSRRLALLKRNLKARRLPCHLCGQPIDYSLPPGHPDVFNADHIKPWSTHPHLREDPANLAAAHASCNKSRGKRATPPALGTLSRDW
ncbi:HNH endonuclease [Georgenia sunbinii]|uniref:HNH endonuclease n=1 Tax=Georgenia sunbinii TaxID=3117728 RepID=UPI003D9C2BEB